MNKMNDNSHHLGKIYSHKLKMNHNVEQKRDTLLIKELQKKKKENKQ